MFFTEPVPAESGIWLVNDTWIILSLILYLSMDDSHWYARTVYQTSQSLDWENVFDDQSVFKSKFTRFGSIHARYTEGHDKDHNRRNSDFHRDIFE